MASGQSIEEFILKKKESIEISSGNDLVNGEKFFDTVEKYSKLFDRCLLRSGDIVLLLGPQDIQYFPFLIAALRHQLIVAPIYERVASQELERVISDLKPKMIYHFKIDRYSLDEESKSLENSKLGGGILFQSSGSTGDPKYIFQPESNLLANAFIALNEQGMSRESTCYNFLTLSHTGGVNMQSLPVLLAGGKLIIEDIFSPIRFIETLINRSVSHSILVPSHYRRLKAKGLISRLKLAGEGCIISGSEPVSNDFYEDMRRIKVRGLGVYGLTEVGPFIAINERPEELPEGTVSAIGTFISEYSAKVDGGEISVQGPGINYRVDIANRSLKALSSKYLLTGDFGKEIDGRFFYTGRGQDEINLGGYKFSGLEVRKALLELPEVKDAVVKKESHDLYNEVPVAYVVLQEKVSESFLKNALREKISSLKIPRKIFLRNSLDETSISKSKIEN